MGTKEPLSESFWSAEGSAQGTIPVIERHQAVVGDSFVYRVRLSMQNIGLVPGRNETATVHSCNCTRDAKCTSKSFVALSIAPRGMEHRLLSRRFGTDRSTQGRVAGHLTIVLLREQNPLVEINGPASSDAIRRAPCEAPRELLPYWNNLPHGILSHDVNSIAQFYHLSSICIPNTSPSSHRKKTGS